MKRSLFVALGAVLIAGCAVGPNYQRPPITSPVEFRQPPAPPPPAPEGASGTEGTASRGTAGSRSSTGAQNVSGGGAVSLADGAWWEILQDRTLQGLIDEALRNGYDVRLAAWRVEEARANAGIARSEFFPQIQGEAGWTRGRSSDFISPVPGTLELYNVNLGLSWEIDVWGRIRRLNEAALARYLATEEARRGVLLSLVSDVATAYFELRALDFELEIAERTADAFEETHDLFSRRYDAGMASELETASAAAPLATTRAIIPDLQRRIVEQENRLALLMGRNPEDIPRGAALNDQLLPPDIPAGLPSALLERRPDVRQAEQQLVAANADVGVTVAEYFPTIGLTGAFGGIAPQVSDLFKGGKTWSIGAGLLTPLFQGRRLKNQNRAAVARWEQAKVDYERTVTNAFAEVSTALVAYERLAHVEQQQEQAVEAYRTAVDLANSRYLSGLSDYLEVLQAQRQLFPAENALAQIRFNRLAVLVGLYRALGGGWQLPDSGWTMAQAREAAQAGPAAQDGASGQD
jgi:outer membrane protein, multidrug efflux system